MIEIKAIIVIKNDKKKALIWSPITFYNIIGILQMQNSVEFFYHCPYLCRAKIKVQCENCDKIDCLL